MNQLLVIKGIQQLKLSSRLLSTLRLPQERMANEERLRQEEKELDFLVPFLNRLDIPEIQSRQLAQQLRNDCLVALKQQIIDKTNLIQARFEKVSHGTCYRLALEARYACL